MEFFCGVCNNPAKINNDVVQLMVDVETALLTCSDCFSKKTGFSCRYPLITFNCHHNIQFQLCVPCSMEEYQLNQFMAEAEAS